MKFIGVGEQVDDLQPFDAASFADALFDTERDDDRPILEQDAGVEPVSYTHLSIFVPHVGCPRQCSFCNQHAITGEAEAPAAADVRETAAQSAAQLGERVHSAEIAFFGGSFTAVPRDYMVSLLEAAHESVKEFGFAGIRCSTRPDAVGEEVLYLLKKYGVTAVELGAQSMDDEVLSLNRRGHTSGQTEAAAQRVKAFGFQLGLQMMTGLYGDTDGRALETAERMIALKPSTVRIYPCLLYTSTVGNEACKVLSRPSERGLRGADLFQLPEGSPAGQRSWAAEGRDASLRLSADRVRPQKPGARRRGPGGGPGRIFPAGDHGNGTAPSHRNSSGRGDGNPPGTGGNCHRPSHFRGPFGTDSEALRRQSVFL